MKFSIKRAGILVAILAIVVLALAGCLCAVNVSNGNDSNLNSIDTNIMTTADKEYLLEGSLDEMAEIWNAAMLESVKYNRHIKLTLMNDWVAKDDSDYITSIGEGYGFLTGRFQIVAGAEITLDLNGCTIDRNMANKGLAQDKKSSGAFFLIRGTFNLVDSKYDIAEVNRVYEANKNQAADATDRVLLKKLGEINCGKITGSDCNPGGSAVMQIDGTLNIYGGMIIGNKAMRRDNLGTGTGGAVCVLPNNVFNMYNGAIVGNSAVYGGGIYTTRAKVFNIQGGLIAENSSTIDGGGIYLDGLIENKATISNCIISHNSATQGGGIGSVAHIEVEIDNVEFIANSAIELGSGAFLYRNKLVAVLNTKFKNNLVEGSGSLYICSYLRCQVKNVEITDNKSKYANYTGISGGTAGLCLINEYALLQESYADVDNVLIKNNVVTEATPTYFLTASGGMFVGGYARTTVDVKNVRIIDNSVDSDSEYAAGGLATISNPSIRIQENVVIDGNTNKNGASNYYLRDEIERIMIVGTLGYSNVMSRIGVTMGVNFNKNSTFTLGYNVGNGIIDPNNYFYSDNTDKKMTLENGEVKLGTETKPTQTALTWRYKANSGSDTAVHDIKGSTITLDYNPDGYTITNSAGKMIEMGGTESTQTDKKIFTNVATYVLTILHGQNYTTPTLTIVIVPKKVDIVWSNTELTYNGNIQLPTAKIAEDASCTVNRTGEQINVGNGYIATATSLSNNANYVINPATSSTIFSIVPATLQINVTTKSLEREYNGKVVTLPDDWYSLSANRLGQDVNNPLDVLFDIDYSAFIPQFNGADSATAVGEYTISTKPFNAKEVFKNNLNYNVSINYVNSGKLMINKPSVVRPTDNSGYDFILSENGRRVNYKNKDLIHGDNDSAISTYVLGNIAPNTSIQTFVSNLSFDITKITIYNRAGDVVYGESAISYYTDNINNGLEVAIGTGWRIEYTKLTGGEETIYLSVLGDLTGDGKVNSADVNYIRKLISDPTMYVSLNDKPYIQLSALIINNGKLTNADGEILWNIVCGKMDIVDFI